MSRTRTPQRPQILIQAAKNIACMLVDLKVEYHNDVHSVVETIVHLQTAEWSLIKLAGAGPELPLFAGKPEKTVDPKPMDWDSVFTEIAATNLEAEEPTATTLLGSPGVPGTLIGQTAEPEPEPVAKSSKNSRGKKEVAPPKPAKWMLSTDMKTGEGFWYELGGTMYQNERFIGFCQPGQAFRHTPITEDLIGEVKAKYPELPAFSVINRPEPIPKAERKPRSKKKTLAQFEEEIGQEIHQDLRKVEAPIIDDVEELLAAESDADAAEAELASANGPRPIFVIFGKILDRMAPEYWLFAKDLDEARSVLYRLKPLCFVGNPRRLRPPYVLEPLGTMDLADVERTALELKNPIDPDDEPDQVEASAELADKRLIECFDEELDAKLDLAAREQIRERFDAEANDPKVGKETARANLEESLAKLERPNDGITHSHPTWNVDVEDEPGSGSYWAFNQIEAPDLETATKEAKAEVEEWPEWKGCQIRVTPRDKPEPVAEDLAVAAIEPAVIEEKKPRKAPTFAFQVRYQAQHEFGPFDVDLGQVRVPTRNAYEALTSSRQAFAGHNVEAFGETIPIDPACIVVSPAAKERSRVLAKFAGKGARKEASVG